MPTESLRRIHQLVGELSSMMSYVDANWYLMFTCLVQGTPRAVANAIINVHKTGEGQRQTIMATAAAVFDAKSDELAFLGRLKAWTDRLSGRRNAAVHSVLYVAEFIVPPRVAAMGGSKPSKLRGKDIETDLRSCLGEAERLADTIRAFTEAMDTCGQPSPALKSPQLRTGWKSLLTNIPPE